MERSKRPSQLAGQTDLKIKTRMWPSNSNQTKPIPAWLKVGFTFWLAIWIPFYWQHYGPQNFLWFCDIGNLVIAVALWRESRLLFSWQAVSLLLVQLAMVIDILGRLVLGFHPIGGTDYFWDAAHYPLHIRLLSLFHVVIPFLLLWAVRRLGYDRRAFGLQFATAWIILPITFLLTSPERDINWVFGPFDQPQHRIAPGIYLALCLAGYPLLLHLPTHLFLAWWRGPKQREVASCASGPIHIRSRAAGASSGRLGVALLGLEAVWAGSRAAVHQRTKDGKLTPFILCVTTPKRNSFGHKKVQRAGIQLVPLSLM